MADSLLPVDQQIVMPCPRCPAQFRRTDLVKHLWLQHHLVVFGQTVREPWQLITDWIEEYRRDARPGLLLRCWELGQHLDPEQGLKRVQRLFLASGIENSEGRQALLAEAAEQGASICPACFALVPVPEVVALRPLNVSRGRLSCPGYYVDLSDSGLVSRLEIGMPGALVYRGTEPDRRLTEKGATLLLAGPPVILALALAIGIGLSRISPLPPVLFLLALAVVLFFWVRIRWQATGTLTGRAVDYAWMMLAPRLLEDGITPAASNFMAALALTSAAGTGRPAGRRTHLQQWLNSLEKAVTAGTGSVACLAALWRLTVEDGARAGADPVPLVVTQVGRCFEGQRSLAFAEHLLAGWESNYWTRANLSRLRILLCDAAFEAGFEVSGLLAAGQVAPALGDALGTGDPATLARLRLLWSLRPGRPWGRLGEASTAFEVAANARAAAKLLGQNPDLLFQVRAVPGLFLCGRNLIFQGTPFSDLPQSVEVKASWRILGKGYHLFMGDHDFWFATDPGPLVATLERWSRYFFLEFLPQVGDVYNWQAPNPAAALLDPAAVRCPGCRRGLLARKGDMGVVVDVRMFDPNGAA